jgi:hypothetical protein
VGRGSSKRSAKRSRGAEGGESIHGRNVDEGIEKGGVVVVVDLKNLEEGDGGDMRGTGIE